MKKTATLLATAALLLATGSPANAAKPGNLDKSFSGDGKTQQAFGGGYQRVTSRDVLVTSTGKVVVVSELRKPGATYWGIARMRKDGKPDPVFRGNGRRTTAFEHDDVPHRVVSQGQGRILVGGSGGGAFALASYDSDGSPNHPFGGAGKVTTDITPGDDVVLDLQVLPGGKVLAAGLAGDQFAVVRYLPTGVPDDTFGGGDGIVLTTDGFDGTAYDVALQPDGRLLAIGKHAAGRRPGRRRGVPLRHRWLPGRDVRRRRPGRDLPVLARGEPGVRREGAARRQGRGRRLRLR